MKIQLFSLAILFTVAALAQKSETRKLESFSGISCGQSIEVEIEAGDREQAIVEVYGAELDDVLTEVWGSTLKIRMEDRNFGWRNVDVKVTITYKSIDRIDVSSSSELTTLNPIVSDELDVEVSSSGEARLDVDVEELSVRVSSSGDLRVRGKADRQEVRVSSSGDYDGYDLESKRARIDVSSSGDARVHVTDQIDADASSSGTVYYRGNPEKVYVDTSSSGKVRKS